MRTFFNICVQRHALQISLALLILLCLCANATAQSTFDARVTIALCPEFQLGGVNVEINYTVGGGEDINTATVITQSINNASNTGTFDIQLPATFRTIPLNVFARCSNSFGTSDASNAVAISNCDALTLTDRDGDGVSDFAEDQNCDNFFSPGDASNPDNVDTDGDGVRDLVEIVNSTDPTNPGSSPRPFILKGSPYDPDGDNNANPVVWRPNNGTWYTRDFGPQNDISAVQYGLPGDVPFIYQPSAGSSSDVGIVRLVSGTNDYVWMFRGPGFQRSDGSSESIVSFGLFGDNLIPGPWEKPGVTNPAVARLFNGIWSFAIYQSDGSVRLASWGGNGDVLKPGDYDGDGIYDLAVFRPSEQKTFIINSSDALVRIIDFGTGTTDHTFEGDVTGDGIDDLTFWEPITGMFSTLTSESNFDLSSAFEFPLGLFTIHLPLSYNRLNGTDLFTVIDHATGLRYIREQNSPTNPPLSLQWGLPGDSQG